ncbi:hypothetical protein G6M86_28265 (plasmid) [Agrobacterium tumefaciens]|uniref:Uncharacterized protein n=1 Tax=Agrobacterium tumefaciens TaxID=358 RepID=A0AAJ4N9F4_AGRTU|nr:hypothetical protein G6M86_28265 [Agrobacterium tumefaciens]
MISSARRWSGRLRTSRSPYLDGVVRWPLVDPARWLWEHRISISRQTLGRELNALGYLQL